MRSCGLGTTRPQPQSAGGIPARRADPKALLSFVQREAGEQQSFTNATNVRMSSRCPTLEFTNSEVRSPSEKLGLKISWRAVLVGESRKRCHDYAPESRALSSAACRNPPRWPCPGQTLGQTGYNKTPAEGHYHLVSAATPATAGRPRTGSDATAPSTSGAAETAPPEEATRALTGVGLPPPPPPRLAPIPLAPPDPVWPSRAQRPRGRGCRWKLYDRLFG